MKVGSYNCEPSPLFGFVYFILVKAEGNKDISSSIKC